MRLYDAVCGLLEAKSALLHQKAETLDLGTYARGLEEGRADAMAEFGIEVQYVVGDDDEDEDKG